MHYDLCERTGLCPNAVEVIGPAGAEAAVSPNRRPGPDILPPDPAAAAAKPDIPAPDPAPLPWRNPGDNPLPPMTDPDIPDQGDPHQPPLRVAGAAQAIDQI